MRFKSDENRRHLAQALYILSGVALVCGLGLEFYLFGFNVETEAPGGVARTGGWWIVQLVGLVVAGVWTAHGVASD
jgi:hypothetical protein